MNRRLRRSIRRILPRRLGPHRILAGPLRGQRIVTSWHDYPGAILGRTETGLLAWFTRHVGAGETWIDVGAHYGYTAVALARLVGRSGRVFAFEPVLATAGCLDRTRDLNALPQLTVLPFGLDDAAELHFVEQRTIRGMACGDPRQDTPSDWLSMLAFDALWSRIAGGAQRVHGVKIDVQGMELQTLRGMTETLRRHQPRLIVELHEGVDRALFTELMTDLGYGGAGAPVDVDHAPGTYENDCSYAFAPGTGTPAV